MRAETLIRKEAGTIDAVGKKGLRGGSCEVLRLSFRRKKLSR